MKKASFLFYAIIIAAICFSGFANAGSGEKIYKYIVIDLGNGDVDYTNSKPFGGWSDKYKTDKLVLRRIEPGTFVMGSPTNELGRFDNETQHSVSISAPFYIGIFEITQCQYYLVTGKNPSRFKGNTRPVENVSYDDIYTFFFKNIKERFDLPLELPTDAQWEYACRAGKTSSWNNGKDITNITKDKELDKLGRYLQNTNDFKGEYTEHTVVGSYRSNDWGLYDMHGNVWEWCSDWYSDSGSSSAVDPQGPNSGTFRVLRGGSWHTDANSCRSAVRNRYYPFSADSNFGFRVILKAEKNTEPSDDRWPPISRVIKVPTNNVVEIKVDDKRTFISIIIDSWNVIIKIIIQIIYIPWEWIEKLIESINNLIVWIKECIKKIIVCIFGSIVMSLLTIGGFLLNSIRYIIFFSVVILAASFFIDPRLSTFKIGCFLFIIILVVLASFIVPLIYKLLVNISDIFDAAFSDLFIEKQ